jgi:hypothetical protein
MLLLWFLMCWLLLSLAWFGLLVILLYLVYLESDSDDLAWHKLIWTCVCLGFVTGKMDYVVARVYCTIFLIIPLRADTTLVPSCQLISKCWLIFLALFFSCWFYFIPGVCIRIPYCFVFLSVLAYCSVGLLILCTVWIWLLVRLYFWFSCIFTDVRAASCAPLVLCDCYLDCSVA